MCFIKKYNIICRKDSELGKQCLKEKDHKFNEIPLFFDEKINKVEGE